MPHQFVRNVRDLELSMCGQCSLGAGNLRSFDDELRNVGVSVCG